MVKIYAPASIGNVGVGFDVLGAAISPVDGSLLGDCVTAQPAQHFQLENKGRFVHDLPLIPEENIVWQCWDRFCVELGRRISVVLTLEKNMPIGSGLGSSACSIVATLMALNEFCGNPLDDNRLLELMGEMEGRISGSVHYDNVAPSFLGGLQLILQEGAIISQRLPVFDNWLWLMAYPGITISTSQARAILPAHYKKAECISHGRQLAGFIHACYTRQPELAASLMKDIIAEPYRAGLLPGFDEVRKTVMEYGALTCGISGSGPTLFTLCDEMDTAERIAVWLGKHYVQNDQGFIHICRLDTPGARKLG